MQGSSIPTRSTHSDWIHRPSDAHAPLARMLGGDGADDMDCDGQEADVHGSNDGRSERRHAVDAAVAVLHRAVEGAGAGARYLRHVDQWVAGLDPSASKLVAFSSTLRKAASRLPAAAREAHGAFVRSIEAARNPETASEVEVADGGADAPPLRQQRVRAAVDDLARAVDGPEGTAYLEKVEAWARRLQPSALSLGALPDVVRKAGTRWAQTTPAALEACNTFVAALKQIRADTRSDRRSRPAPPKASAVLDGGVRAAPDAAFAARVAAVTGMCLRLGASSVADVCATSAVVPVHRGGVARGRAHVGRRRGKGRAAACVGWGTGCEICDGPRQMGMRDQRQASDSCGHGPSRPQGRGGAARSRSTAARHCPSLPARV